MQKNLDFLLEKYAVDTPITLIDRDTATVKGRTLPLLSHRWQRRFVELRNLTQGGTLSGVSVMRVARILPRGTDLYRALYRELDLCRFILGREITAIMAVDAPGVLNVMATAEDGVVCTLELAATLAEGETPKDKHEIIAAHGIACDVVVDAQLQQDSIYVFGQENDTYTDVDFELFGLPAEDIAVVRAAFSLARDEDFDARVAEDKQLTALVDLARRSVQSGEREVL